ncbi:hypothetical protein EPA93_39050 [Ktedonosporobacter rubrisoli]|uniref:Protein kinase domain-containing protein n=1 Tax=Ktedonosporobacter rubrisoli TaxID=2509675 RepID=A0A4V0Z016_KTERU|nr:serine/threonine-protein kinase [Ktedonosporobacter rubrisoli]QBD81651.1 hypothetical protein EPA93_39050 [Ktedonosporobacter rubrisoli]
MPDRVGQQLGNYRLTSILGQGGFAEVYLGQHVYLGTQAAIKVLHTQLSSGDAERFHTEARTVAHLIHPHIVRVLEFGIDNSTPFLVVDYAPNGTLRKRYPSGTLLPLAAIVSYVRQAADALQYAHEQRIIHRDVKPENMLLGRRNELLLSDFGIALVAQSARYNSTQSMQELAGTIAYMAPEQIQAQAGPASDQYSLAIIVYEWLCGARPFQGSFAEVAVKHTLVSPPPLRERVPELSEAIEKVVLQALAKDPKQRFPDITAFATALEQAYHSEPVPEILQPRAPTQDEVPVSAETVLLADAVVAPVVAAVSDKLAPVTENLTDELSTRASADVAEEDGLETTPLPEAMALEKEVFVGNVEGKVASPEKETNELEVVAQPEKGSGKKGRTGVITRRKALFGLAGALGILGVGGAAWAIKSQVLSSPLATPLPINGSSVPVLVYRGHDAMVWSVAWSPDGKHIVSGSGDKTVQVWDARTGSPLYTYNGHTDSVYAVAWSPDSRRIASAGYDQTVQVWNAATGFYPYTYTGHSSWVWSLAWSHNGKRIASGSGDQTVQVWDATNGENAYVYRGSQGFIHSIAWSPDDSMIVSSDNREAQVWDPASGNKLDTYRPYAAAIWSVAWSPDGKRIASACDDKTVQVWDAIGGDHRYVYYGHSDFVYAVAWSPDGKRIASAGEDKTVQVWNATDGSNVITFRGHTNSIHSLAWSPDSKRLASASWDMTVQVWQIP